MSDLVKRLRAYKEPAPLRHDIAEAAATLEAQAAEIERLRASELAKENERLKQWIDLHRGDTMSLSNEVENFRSEMIAAESRAEKAESALAEAVAIIKLGLDVVSEERGWGTYPRMEGSEIYYDADVFSRAARQLNEDLK